MRVYYISLVLCFAISLSGRSQDDTRIRHSFNSGWKFILNDSLEARANFFDEERWQHVQIPHDWSIHLDPDPDNGGSMGFLPGGTGWYRKTFSIPGDYSSKRILIRFDGIYHQSDVYINGRHVGFHPYGYSAFEYDISQYLNYGRENEIVIEVNHRNSPSSRWYSGSGIYRNVWLEVVNPVHVSTWGTYITTPVVTDGLAEVHIETTISNSGSGSGPAQLVHEILSEAGEVVARSSTEFEIAGQDTQDISSTIKLFNPSIWDIDHPVLYKLRTEVRYNGVISDLYWSQFGIRTFRFDADEGFYLNGRNIKLKGVNLHSDGGLVGAAVPEGVYLRRLKILKEFGCNAIRCAHNPPTTEFLNMCDSLGFVVIDEIFDKWKTTGWFFGYYTTYFDDWWQRDLNAMIHRDRNHPSIILWSVGNEVSEQGDSLGVSIGHMLQDYVHQIEPTRPVTLAIGPGDLAKRKYHENGFTEIFDVIGYNYSEPMMKEYHEAYPEAIMYVSEAFPYYNGRRNFVRDYSPNNPWYVVANNDFLFGQFIWSGIDYLGESSGYPSTGWPTGLFDVCMFEKPRAAFHRAVWNEEPMVRVAVVDQSLDIDPGKDHWSWPHLAAHWNFPQYEGHVIEVETTTNCDSVSLYVNEKWLGKRSTSDYPNQTITWHVPYVAGQIRAVGFIGSDSVATYRLITAGEPHSIRLSADKTILQSDGTDVAHITIEVLDKNGVEIRHTPYLINIELLGPGKLIGLGNGDLRRTKAYSLKEEETYFGRLLAIVQSERSAGAILIRAESEGLPPQTITINSE